MQNSSSIFTTSSLQPIIDACAEASEQTLVIFDIDDVIVTPLDAAFQTDERRVQLYKKLRTHNDTVMWSAFIWPQCNLSLVDPLLLNLFCYLKNTAIKTLGLTAGWAGAFGEYQAFEHIRAQRLADLGINFDWSFDCSEKIIFNHEAQNARRPVFFKGIIFACRLAKSLVLQSFLEHQKYMPRSIIFIDDSMHNIYDIQAFCAAHNLDLRAFHYTGATNLLRTFCPTRAAIQQQHLKKTKQWLIDAQADKLINAQ